MSRPASGGGGGGTALILLLIGLALAGAPADTPAANTQPTAAPAADEGTAAIYQHAVAAGLTPDQAVTATAIALGESAGHLNAVGDEHLTTGTWGPSVCWWQIRTLHDQTGTGGPRDINALTDPAHCAHAMHTISAGGTDWTPWTVYTTGDYRTHLPAAQQAAQ